MAIHGMLLCNAMVRAKASVVLYPQYVVLRGRDGDIITVVTAEEARMNGSLEDSLSLCESVTEEVRLAQLGCSLQPLL